MKKALAIVAALVILGYGISRLLSSAKSYHPAAPAVTTTKSQSSPAPPAQVDTSTAATPKTTSPVSSQQIQLNDSPKAAAQQAALAVEILAKGPLEKVSVRREGLRKTVLPSKRRQLEAAFRYAGNGIARVYGYRNLSQARALAEFFFTPQRWRVENFQAGSATVLIYGSTHLVRGPYSHPQKPTCQECWVPGITVAIMSYINGQWWYAGTRQLTADEGPPELAAGDKRSTTELEERFVPYLRGYLSYDGTD